MVVVASLFNLLIENGIVIHITTLIIHISLTAKNMHSTPEDVK